MLIYLAFTILSDWGMRRVERRYGLR
jgi:hypothetical protein